MPDLIYDSALRGAVKMDPHRTSAGNLYVLADALRGGMVRAITLDPGDATAYDLVLAPLHMMDGSKMIVGQLLVARTRGRYGAFVSACTFTNPRDTGDFAFSEAMDKLVPRLKETRPSAAFIEPWEHTLLSWWLRELWELL